VELAFFFPWAVVFGSANRAGDETQSVEYRAAALQALQPTEVVANAPAASTILPRSNPGASRDLAGIAFLDIMVFFAVLLVGFAYLWRRGDLAWVRSTAAQDGPAAKNGVG
jgi:NADH-quinone oxidoreductase subunit A